MNEEQIRQRLLEKIASKLEAVKRFGRKLTGYDVGRGVLAKVKKS